MDTNPPPPRRRRTKAELSSGCLFDGCDRPRYSNNLCTAHDRQRSRGQALVPIKIFHKTCTFGGCGRPHMARGWCNGHLKQFVAGKVLVPLQVRDGTRSSQWRLGGNGYVFRNNRDAQGRTIREYQHRVVMEQVMGRPLATYENIHHLNGSRTDNRPENLELWVTRQPQGQRVTDQIEWALSILQEYRPEALAHPANPERL